MPNNPEPSMDGLCPHCGTALRPIDERPGKEAWVCPVALEGKIRGLIGPGRKHADCFIYKRERQKQE